MSYKEQPCIYNNGVHNFELTGKSRDYWAGTGVQPPNDIITILEIKCIDCGDTRWR